MIYHSYQAMAQHLNDAASKQFPNTGLHDPMHQSELNEAFKYLALHSFNRDDQQVTLLKVTNCRESGVVNSFSGREAEQFKWNGNILGEFTPIKEEGIRKGIRYVPYEQMAPLAFNSATLSPPIPQAARAAYVTATLLSHFAETKNTRQMEELVANVSRTAFESLCSRYRVDTHTSEVLFDDNATMALYQWLGMLDREGDKFAMTFFDTGRVMPQALSGLNPEFLPDNFHPAMDVWCNRERVKGNNCDLSSWECDLVEHYTDRYLSDEEILAQTILLLETTRPEVVVIPTVTRTGRRVNFVEVCEEVKSKASELGYSPLIVLDDAQGLGRMTPSRYFTRQDGSMTNLWNYADAVLLTGAKVTGALMGSGAILYNKESFEKRQLPFGVSPLQYRARQYALISDDLERVYEHNQAAPGIAQTPEISSLTMAMGHLPKPDEVYHLMRQMREFVVDKLKQIPGVKVLEPEKNTKARFEDSIVAFYLEDYPSDAEVRRFRGYLAQPREMGKPDWDNLPITLPAIISADRRHYLRLALDPARAVSPDESYLLKVSYVLDTMRDVMIREFPARSLNQ
jgi:hypothetical protein